MAELTFDGEPLESLEKISVTVPVPKDWADDIASLQCMMWLGLSFDTDPLTPEESRTGWRTRPHGDHEHTYAVAWRAEEQAAKAKALREAEMAACPYVACECGHHEDY